MLTEDARLGALCATEITCICRGGTTAKAAESQMTKANAAPIAVVAKTGNSSIISMSNSKKPIKVLSKDRSANLPPK